MKKITSLLISLFFALPVFSQEVEMADGLRSEGKIYVVVSILLVVLLGLTVYLVMIDRKVSKLEKKVNKEG